MLAKMAYNFAHVNCLVREAPVALLAVIQHDVMPWFYSMKFLRNFSFINSNNNKQINN